MKFAMSYSCGKDSTLALHKMLEQGHEPVCLVIMVNEEAGRSYFHGADSTMLERYSQALVLPVISCPAVGTTYHRQPLKRGWKRQEVWVPREFASVTLTLSKTGSGRKDVAEPANCFRIFHSGSAEGKKLSMN